MIEVVREYSIDEVKQIEVRLARGDVKAAPGEVSTVTVRARVHAPEDAELKIALEGGRLFAGHQSMDGTNGNGFRAYPAIDIDLLVPAGADPLVTVQTGKGDVRLNGMRRAQSVRTGKGDVSVSGTVNGLQIDSGAGDVSVSGCGGELNIHTGAGDVAVSACQANVTAKTGRGDVSIDEVIGALEINTGSGDVSVGNWQTSDNGTASIGTIHTGSGDISVGNAYAGSLRVQTGRGDCSLGQVRLGKLDVNTGSGDLALSGDPGTGRWQAKTGKGDMVLKLPATTSARIEAATRHGDIRSDLPQVKVGRPGPASQHGGRTIIVLGDEPRAEVILESGKGDIAVRASGPMPVAAGQQVAVAEVVASQVLDWPSSQPVPATRTAPTRDVTMGVLESLSRGEISVDEAEMLLKAMG